MNPRTLARAAAGAILWVAAPVFAQPLTHRAALISDGEDFTCPPLALTTTSAVVSTLMYSPEGPSGRFALVEHLDSTPSVTPLTGPEVLACTSNVAGWGHTGIVRLSATRVLSAHWGPDARFSGDEGVVLFDDLGGENEAVSIPLGWMGDPHVVRLDERTVTVASDHEPTGSFLLSDLGGTNQVTPLPGVVLWFAVTPTRVFGQTAASSVILRLDGPEPVLVPLPDVGTGAIALEGRELLGSAVGGLRYFPDVDDPTVSTLIPFPPLCALVRLGPDRALGRGPGPDGACGKEQDEIAWIEDVGGSNRVTVVRLAEGDERGSWDPVPLGDRTAVVTARRGNRSGLLIARMSGLTRFIPRARTEGGVRALSPRRFLAANVGASPYENRDDEAFDVFTLGRGRKVETAVVPFALGSGYFGPPELLGNGRAVYADAGFFGPFGDYPTTLRHLRVVEGLPDGIRLEDVALSVAGSDVGLDAGFELPVPATFGAADLTLRVGDVSQTIPAAAIQERGRRFEYRDPDGANGFFRFVAYDARARTLHVEGRSVEPEAPLGTNRVVSLESTEFYVASAAE